MDLCIDLCLFGWLAGCLAWQRCWTLYTSVPIRFIHTCHACRHHWLLPFYVTFEWPWPWLRVKSSAQSKTSLHNFLTHFSADQDEVCYGVETTWTSWNNSGWMSWMRFMKQEKELVLLTASKKLYHWHAFRRFWIDLVQTWHDDR